jgi:hypothetical protein
VQSWRSLKLTTDFHMVSKSWTRTALDLRYPYGVVLSFVFNLFVSGLRVCLHISCCLPWSPLLTSNALTRERRWHRLTPLSEYRLCTHKPSNLSHSLSHTCRMPALEMWMHVTAVAITMTSTCSIRTNPEHSSVDSYDNTSGNPRKSLSFLFEF